MPFRGVYDGRGSNPAACITPRPQRILSTARHHPGPTYLAAWALSTSIDAERSLFGVIGRSPSHGKDLLRIIELRMEWGVSLIHLTTQAKERARPYQEVPDRSRVPCQRKLAGVPCVMQSLISVAPYTSIDPTLFSQPRQSKANSCAYYGFQSNRHIRKIFFADKFCGQHEWKLQG